MRYEVERKFPIQDPVSLASRLTSLGATRRDMVEQIDRYFNHPARDFAVTDEAVRIRSVGAHNVITYKGPKVDATTKTRRELELPIAPGEEGARAFCELLTTLGFRRVAEVRKRRERFDLCWRDRVFEAALDEVDGLGQFAELETSADEGSLSDARETLAALALELQLANDERRSYLQLLLERPSIQR